MFTLSGRTSFPRYFAATFAVVPPQTMWVPSPPKKREAAYMGMLRQEIDKLAESLGGTVDWDNPLGPEVFG